MTVAPLRGARVREDDGRVTAKPDWRMKREVRAKKTTTKKRTLTKGMTLKSQRGIFNER